MEWLEVRIVVQNECLTMESRIKVLNGDWEPIDNKKNVGYGRFRYLEPIEEK